jgi:hypothetical protein
MALLLVQENGQPLNQLGTLFGSENYGVDAAYYYIYCLSCSIPFHGAKENLKLLFSKNRKRYEEIKSISINSDKQKRNDIQSLKEIHSKDIKKFLVLFLYIIDQFLTTYLETNTKPINSQNINHLQELCQICLQEFNSCMFYKSFETSNQQSMQNNSKMKNKGSNGNDKLSYLPNDLIFKLSIMILMTIERLKKAKFVKTNSNNKDSINTTLFTAIAFAFIFFSHVINHSILRFQEDIFNLKKEREKKIVKDTDTVTNDENRSSDIDSNSDDTKRSNFKRGDSNDHSSDVSSSGAKKKKINLIFGRRRRQRNSDSDSNSQDSENENYDAMRQKKFRNQRGRHTKHEYLSEDELNDLSSDEEECEDEKKQKRKENRRRTSSSASSSSSISPNETKTGFINPQVENRTEIQQNDENIQENNYYYSKIIPLMDANKSNISANFKDFSTQLFTNYSLFESKFDNFASAFNDNNELIDNEIYKSVLNGNKQVSVPPGFENNSKEVQEIEELGKKLATFQIETDTEMSVFNSDTNNNSSSNDSSLSSGGEESENSVLQVPTKQENLYNIVFLAFITLKK